MATVQELLEAAKCFGCVPKLVLPAIQNHILDVITDGGHDHGGFIPTKVPTPENLTFVYDPITDRVVATWGPIPSPTPPITLTNVQVSYSSAAGPWTISSSVFVPTTTANFAPPGPGNSAWCRVRYFNGTQFSAFTAVVQATQPASPLINDLVSYWKLEEANGATRIDTLGVNDLADEDSNVTQVAAVVANGINLPNLGDAAMKLRKAAAPTLAGSGGKSFTISAWVKVVVPVNNAPFLARWGAAFEYLLWSTGTATDRKPQWTVRNAANAASISLVCPLTMLDGTWYHFVMGYDDSTQTTFLQVNCSPRQTAACVGVNNSGGGFALGNYDVAGADTPAQASLDEVGFWDRVLTLQEVADLYNDGQGLTHPFTSPAQHPIVTDWNTRVIANGGAAPSAGTLAAANTFVNAIQLGGPFYQMRAVNIFAPDNLIACLTPLIKFEGNDPWTNNGPFLLADLSVNGLQGDGATKFLDTGLNGTSAAVNQNVGQTAYYIDVAPPGFGVLIGSATAADYNNAVALQASNAQLVWDCPYQGGLGRAFGNKVNWIGYLSGNRVSSTDQRIFIASNTQPHGLFASNLAATGFIPNAVSQYVYRLNFGVPTYYNGRISFAALHNGMTQAESLVLFNAITALRTTFGGGFV